MHPHPHPQPQPRSLVHIRLITIGPSHFCEKARWGLDMIESDPYSPYYYTEDAHPPLFAGIATLEASNGEASMTPMVVYTEQGGEQNQKELGVEKVIYDSSNILQHFCGPLLYPPSKKDEIIKMESYLGTNLGATLRVIF